MLDDVGSLHLDLLGDPQLVVELEEVEEDGRDSPGPGRDDEEAHHLGPDLVHGSHAVLGIKHSSRPEDERRGQDSHYPSSGVDSHRVKRVVNPEPDHGVVDDGVGEGGQYPHHEGGPGSCGVTEGTGGDHSSEDPVHGGEETPLLPGGEPEAEECDQATAGPPDHGVDDRSLDHVPVLGGVRVRRARAGLDLPHSWRWRRWWRH